MIIEKTLGNIRNYNINGREVQTIKVNHQDFAKSHQKLKSEDGEVFAVSLERGHHLHTGTIIYEDEKRVVYVDLAPEECLVIRPDGNIQWAMAAFNIGNMHQAAYIHDDCILVAYDRVLESVMHKLGIECRCEERRLDGVRANAAQSDCHHHEHLCR